MRTGRVGLRWISTVDKPDFEKGLPQPIVNNRNKLGNVTQRRSKPVLGMGFSKDFGEFLN